jgi:hypothetical protein
MGVSKQRAVQQREKEPGKIDGSTDWNEFIFEVHSDKIILVLVNQNVALTLALMHYNHLAVG